MRRPHWLRWLAATSVAILTAPSISPLSWFVVIAKESDLQALAVVFFWTYVVGLPLAVIGMVPVLLVSIIWFRSVAQWPPWKWSLLGAGVGLGIVILLSGSDIVHLHYAIAIILLLLTGATCGAVAVLIFRAILLRHKHQ